MERTGIDGDGDGEVDRRSSQIVVIDGPDRGRSCPLLGRDLIIGAHIDCDLVLSSDGISGRHAAIREHRGHFIVRDLGSRNGTWHHSTRITEATVPAGATLLLARTQLRIESAAPRSPREPDGLAVRSDLPWIDARATALQELERRYLGEVLVRCHGDLGAASRASGIDRKHLRAMVRRHGLVAIGLDADEHDD